MSLELDALWNEFAAETEEHLDALERLLSDQRRADWTRDEIAALFRYFHSLKGTFLAMGFVNVEVVAHHCEDILSLVREGRSVLDPELTNVLLRTVDRLKDMREEVIATRQDAKPAPECLRELERHRESRTKVEADRPPVAAADVPLSDDPEMLAIYSELMEQRLPNVALAASLDSNERAAAAETAGELAYGAEMMGFEALAQQLQAIAAWAAPGDPAERGRLIAGFSELHEQAKIIEDVTQVPSGAAPFAVALAAQLIPDCKESLDTLTAALSRLDEEGAAAEAVVAAQAVRTLAACLGLEHIARLLLLIEERFRSVEILETVRFAVFGDLAREAVEAFRRSVETATDIEAEEADLLAMQWAASFHEPLSDAAAAMPADRLRPEVLATLSAEQRARLDRSLADGRHAYELLLELEAHPDIAGDLITWLSSAVETITSRTVFRDGANCFEFLIFSEQASDWIAAQLAALDPERACLRGLVELGDAPLPIGAAEAGVPATGLASRAPLIRVHSESIDELMAEVGEMRTALARFADIVRHGRIATAVHDARRFGHQARHNPELRQHIEAMEADLRDFDALEHKLEAAHRRIWGAGLQLRVIPVDALFGRLSRAARDLAQKLGKNVDVVVEGREVRIDKSMVDLLIDPLMHMVRNAIDHGIESPQQRRAAGKSSRARLLISASERGNNVDIVVADDGKGLDRSKILAKALALGMVAPHQLEQMPDRDVNALIFQPGFSTADAVTEVSGRGVGMDVVAASLQRLGGVIDMETAAGAGTHFILKLPLSAALLRTLLVEVEDQIFALPERQVVTVLEYATAAMQEIGSWETVVYGAAAIPVRSLAFVLGFDTTKPRLEFTQLVIVSTGTRMFGLRVDRVVRFQDLFLKELHPMLAALPVIAGASVLGDGRPVLVLDARGLESVSPAGPCGAPQAASSP